MTQIATPKATTTIISLLQDIQSPTCVKQQSEKFNRIRDHDFTVEKLVYVMQQSLQSCLLWVVCNCSPMPTYSLLNDQCILTILSSHLFHDTDTVVWQVIHTLLLTRHNGKFFLSSESAWRAYQAKSPQQIHIFELLLAFLFHTESVLSPSTFGLLYWALPTQLRPFLIRWMNLCYSDPLPIIHTTLFHTAQFPPPLCEIGAPLWQTSISSGRNGYQTVFQAYVCATINNSETIKFPMFYLKPSLDTFANIETFWFDLSQWVFSSPHLVLSRVFFSQNPEWENCPDMLFILLDQLSNKTTYFIYFLFSFILCHNT